MPTSLREMEFGQNLSMSFFFRQEAYWHTNIHSREVFPPNWILSLPTLDRLRLSHSRQPPSDVLDFHWHVTRDILWIYCQTRRCETTRTMVMTQKILRPFEDKTISVTKEDFHLKGLHVIEHIWAIVLQRKVCIKTHND